MRVSQKEPELTSREVRDGQGPPTQGRRRGGLEDWTLD